MITTTFILALIVAGVFLLTKQASLPVWTISYAVIFACILHHGSAGVGLKIFLWCTLAVSVILCIRPLRRVLVSAALFRLVKRSMPVMSVTEREALEAGTVGWEAELFSGRPNFDLLLNLPPVHLTVEEQAFLDGPTNVLCRMLDDWDITHNLTDLPADVWSYIKSQGFLGMIIPKQYGGLGFSATAHMSVLVKLYGRSITAATTIGVPNALGPAELLHKYGTEEQKGYYLPRLANGREIPCFALTGPNAGSDAASIPDRGVVCQQILHGKEVLGIRLNWDKRYITLSPIATVIGLAFRLFDPDNRLGKGTDIGITCALIPVETPGVVTGRRHFPLNTGFLNGPTQGRDVFVPIDHIIGGAAMAGQGWRMLMECLSAGRAISLPSSALGGAQVGTLVSGAYARVRRQFSQPIAKFEGIEAPLARIAGNTYMIDAGITMTAAAIDQGAKPSVAGAILKYHSTELSRKIALDAMDIHGGKGICLGPNNYLGRAYQNAPIAITVEGANILTRNLIIFGQGAVRCHPYVYREMESVRNQDLSAFDVAFWGHAGFFLANTCKTALFAATDARWTNAPDGITKRYFQLIHRYSSNLAFLADFAMMVLGGKLKRKESISARLGDILSALYFVSAVLKRYANDGHPESDLPLVHWCCQQLFYDCDVAIREVVANFPVKWAQVVLKGLLQPFGGKRVKPSDRLGQRVAQLVTQPTETRTRLTRLAFSEALENCPLGRLEEAFYRVCEVEALEKKVLRAVKEHLCTSLTFLDQIEEALQQKIINVDEAQQLNAAELARQQVIAVDDFADYELRRSTESKNHTIET